MRKFLRFELKKMLPYLLLTTALISITYMIFLATMKMSWVVDGRIFIGEPHFWVLHIALVLLAFINPIIVYSFKMTKRGVDGYYALPINRRKLFLIKTLVGIILTLVPFTVAYLGGVIVLLCRTGNPYYMQWYAIGYLGFVLLGICIFGVNAFAFTRANRIGDGILFMIAYAFIGSLTVAYVERAAHTIAYWWIDESFSIWGSISAFGGLMSDFIMNNHNPNWTWWIFLYPTVVGVACYMAMFVLLKKEKSESAEQISEGWWGYKSIIPVYTALGIGVLPFNWLGLALVVIASIAVTMLYRCKLLFSWKYWLMIGIGITVGVLLMLLVGVLEPPIANPPDFA